MTDEIEIHQSLDPMVDEPTATETPPGHIVEVQPEVVVPIETPAPPILTGGSSVPSQALRYNQDKVQYSYIDLKCLKYTAQVLEFGANKYSRDNWKLGMPTSKIIDSLLRHIAALQDGEVIDPESGLPHIGHIGANTMFLGNTCNKQDIKVLPDALQ